MARSDGSDVYRGMIRTMRRLGHTRAKKRSHLMRRRGAHAKLESQRFFALSSIALIFSRSFSACANSSDSFHP